MPAIPDDLAIAILDENLKGPTAAFDEQGLAAVRSAWLAVRPQLLSAARADGPGGGERFYDPRTVESVARVIDPLPFADGWVGMPVTRESRRTAALEKARRILALSPVMVEGGLGTALDENAATGGEIEARPIPGFDGYRATSDGQILGPQGHPLLLVRDYPRVKINRPGRPRRRLPVHILVARAFLGERPAGHDVDHIDGDKKNSAPSNLRYLPAAANRSAGGATCSINHNARKTHCVRNHEFTAENTRVNGGKRYCRACKREERMRLAGTPADAPTPAAPVDEPSGWPKPADRMWFLGKNGYDAELERAKARFAVGQEVVVQNISVGSWSHTIAFAGVEGRWNGVMFTRVPMAAANPEPPASVISPPTAADAMSAPDTKPQSPQTGEEAETSQPQQQEGGDR